MVFENEHFLIVDKRAGFLSVPSRLGEKDTRGCEVVEWRKQTGLNLLPCHRLDEEVSGLLLFAKQPDAHRAANLWFEERSVQKIYEAIGENRTEPLPTVRVLWKSLLLRGKKRAHEKTYGKPSQTEAEVLEKYEKDFSLWRLHPLTGRPHQLRFKMSKHGHPIWGDTLYGAKIPFLTPHAIALRAVELDFSRCPRRQDFGLPEKVQGMDLKAWVQSASRSSK